jgi:hypothetical protein
LLSLPLMGIYFRYFLDPDQGQTGPVSWEVAPLPPPRPVLTCGPYTFLQQPGRRSPPLRRSPAREFGAAESFAALSQGARFPHQNHGTRRCLRPRDELHSGQQRPVRLKPGGFQLDLAARQAASLLPPRFRGVPLQGREHLQEDGQCRSSDGDRCAARNACLPPSRWHA